MTRLEYELLREEMPHLKLRAWTLLWDVDWYTIQHHTRDSMIAARGEALFRDRQDPSLLSGSNAPFFY